MGFNIYLENAAGSLAIFASYFPDTDSKKKSYIFFVKSQIGYMLCDNPMGVNNVVGREEDASGTYDSIMRLC